MFAYVGSIQNLKDLKDLHSCWAPTKPVDACDVDVDARECCCVNATRVSAADANDGSDVSRYALTREGSALTIVRGF